MSSRGFGPTHEVKTLLTSLQVGEEMAAEEERPLALPVGTATLLLADIVASTQLQESDQQAAGQWFSHYDQIVTSSIGANGGVKPRDQGEGDSFLAAFSRPSDAVTAALEIQVSLAEKNSPLRPRMAVHTGEVQLRDNTNYIGLTVNRAARIRAVAHGGQIVISEVTRGIVADNLPEEISFKDLGVHRLKDLSRPEHLFQLVHPDLESEFPPLTSVDALPNNLPIQRTTFIGRIHEMEEVKKSLDSTRLLTLSGAGGSGKTRLAVQVAADLLDAFADGVWFVDLAVAEEDDEVEGDVAEAVGLTKSQGELLTIFVGSKSMLLILDNAEQVIAGVVEVSEKLLDSCPGVKILITSREALNIQGETIYRVPSLSLPEDRQSLRVEALSESESIQLFIDRAAKARPNFKLTEENAPEISAICRRLDGIPLAIELAAVRIRVLSPAQILEGLSDRFRLLTGRSRTSMPRQQTLRASVAWSYDLLDEVEQKVLRRLSVFPAPFDLDAAEDVASSQDLDRLVVLDVLTRLVDKSLVVATDAGTSTEYSLLETIRQFSLDRLRDSMEEASVRLRHRDHYLRRGEEVWEAVMSGIDWDEVVWSAGFAAAPNWANSEAALEWTLQREEAELASRMFSAGVLGAHWLGRDWLSRFLDKVLPLLEERDLDRGRVLASLATLAGDRWDLAPYAQEAVELLRSLPESQASKYLPSTLLGLGMVSMYLDRANAHRLLEEAIEIAEKYGQTYWVIWGEATAGYLQTLDGAVEAGLTRLKKSVEQARKLENRVLLGGLLFQTGLAHLLAGRADEAIGFYEEAIPLMRKQKLRNKQFQWALDHLSQIHMEAGRLEDARPYVEEALAFSRDYDLQRGNYWNLLEKMATIKWHDGAQEEALALQITAADGYRGDQNEDRTEAVIGALSQLARMELERGDRASASSWATEAMNLAREYEPQMGKTGIMPVRRVDVPLGAFARLQAEQEPARAARLRGFMQAWRGSNALRWDERAEALWRERLQPLEAALGAKRLKSELEVGENLPMEASVAYALGETSDPIAAMLLAADAVEAQSKVGAVLQPPKIPALPGESSVAVPSAKGYLLLADAWAKRETDPNASEHWLDEVVSVGIQLEDLVLVAASVELMAVIAADRESYEEAARLCGAALAVRERSGMTSMRCEMKRVVDALGERFDVLVEEGKALTPAEAAEYAARGRGERKRPTTGWTSLTPTELRVAELVAEGLSNPQVAERLFVSKRTIQTHLYHIFSKLGVESRTELAAEFIRHNTG